MRALYLITALCLIAQPAGAQDRISSGETLKPDKERVCKRVYEMIIPLRLPTFSAPVDWRALPGRTGMDRISGVSPVQDKEHDFIAIGRNARPLQDDAGPKLLRYGFRRDGFNDWRKTTEMVDLVAVEGVVAGDNGPVAVATVRYNDTHRGVKLIYMDKQGKILDTKTIRDAKRNLRVRDVIAAKGQSQNESEGFYLLVQANLKNRSENGKSTGAHKPAKIGRIYRLQSNGDVAWQRGYSAGTNSRLNTIAYIGEGTYITAGQSRRSGGGYAGWALSLDEKGAVRWQKSYPRGGGAIFDAVDKAPGKRIVLIGRARPKDAGGQAGWVLYIDDQGLAVWQRFYTGAYNYKGVDVHVGNDGRIFAFFNATPAQDAGRQFARVLGLNIYGHLLSDHAYIGGSHANMRGMRRTDNGRTLIYGAAQTGFVEPDSSSAKVANAYDGWLLARPKTNSYKSPCFDRNE